jgi:hypothetical protein
MDLFFVGGGLASTLLVANNPTLLLLGAGAVALFLLRKI